MRSQAVVLGVLLGCSPQAAGDGVAGAPAGATTPAELRLVDATSGAPRLDRVTAPPSSIAWSVLSSRFATAGLRVRAELVIDGEPAAQREFTP
ncbi:MAG: hypothetical protein JNL82_34375 [Myxococcales bacterium]|nr:hypothetical protein [Myxococcales bacterium]